jgi:hypothetical protein
VQKSDRERPTGIGRWIEAKTRRAFAAYWFVIRPGSSAIRREVLKVVARRAESSIKAR